MLWHKTIGAGGISQGLELVDTFSAGDGTNNSITIDISSASLEADDLILVAVSFTDGTNRDISATGYTELADLRANDTADTQLYVGYKVSDGTETSIVVTTNTSAFQNSLVYIWRGADPTVPIDVTTATALATNGNMASSPDVTTNTDNAVIMQLGAAAGTGSNNVTAFTAPSGTENFLTRGGGVNRMGACSSIQETAGTTSLNDFGGGVTGSSDQSSAVVTVAIRPLVNNRAVEYSGDSDFVGSSGGTLSIPALASNQMVVITERANSSTPPSTRAGFTSILTNVLSARSRSMRSSYRVGGSAENITFSLNANYVIFNYATTVGQTATYSENAFATPSMPIPAISSLDTGGNSAIWATSYHSDSMSAASSPYNMITDVGAYIEENTSSSLAQGTFTIDIQLYYISAAMEIKN